MTISPIKRATRLASALLCVLPITSCGQDGSTHTSVDAGSTGGGGAPAVGSLTDLFVEVDYCAIGSISAVPVPGEPIVTPEPAFGSVYQAYETEVAPARISEGPGPAEIELVALTGRTYFSDEDGVPIDPVDPSWGTPGLPFSTERGMPPQNADRFLFLLNREARVLVWQAELVNIGRAVSGEGTVSGSDFEKSDLLSRCNASRS